MVLRFEFNEVQVRLEAWVVDSQGDHHRIKGSYPSLYEAEKSIAKLLEGERDHDEV